MKTLLWLGAGDACEPALDMNEFSEVVLVEARESEYSSLTVDSPTIINKLITLDGKTRPLSVLNLDEYSSVKTPTGLKSVFPNIQTEETLDVPAVSLDEILEQATLSGSNNSLIVDLPCLAGEIVEHLVETDQLSFFSEIIVRVGVEPLYEGGVSAAQITETLSLSAYNVCGPVNSDSDIPLLRFTFDEKQAELNKKDKIIHELSQEITEKETKYKEVYSWFSHRKKQAQELQSRVEALTHENDVFRAQIEKQKSLSEMESRLTSLLDNQRTENVEIANALGRHVTSSRIDAEETFRATFELQKLTGMRDILMAYSPYSMSAANLVHLASTVRNNNFDAIIEFGSGISTLVLASVLKEKLKQTKSEVEDAQHQMTAQQSSDVADIVKSNPLSFDIISFEQSGDCFEESEMLLCDNKLNEFVDLCLSTLTDAVYRLNDAESALFYDCNEKLIELQQHFEGREANILIVVDGPDDDSGNSGVRYPALPAVLDKLSAHKLSFFLDDSKREQESNVLTAWKEEVERRNLKFDQQNIDTARGAALIHVSPLQS